MLQTVGFLGCLLLLIKGLEILSSRDFKHHTGEWNIVAIITAALALSGAAIFAVVLHKQGTADVGVSEQTRAR